MHALNLSTNKTAKSLRQSRLQQSNPRLHRVSGLTWSQVLCVRDQVLHGLHHLRHCQVLQDAFAHADDFADL